MKVMGASIPADGPDPRPVSPLRHCRAPMKMKSVAEQQRTTQSSVAEARSKAPTESRPTKNTLAGLGVGLLLMVASTLLPSCGTTRSSLAESPTVQLAEQAVEAEDWPRAAELWYAVHRAEEEKTPRPYVETARALYESGDSESACGMLDQGIQRFPYEVELLETKGQLLEECGYQRAAEATYARLVAADRQNCEALAALARLRLALGLERSAQEPLERLVELGAADATTLVQLGDIRLVRGERMGALQNYARAIELGSEDERVLLVAVQLSRDSELLASSPNAAQHTLSWLEQLAVVSPQNSKAHYLRGVTLCEAGRDQDAIEALRRSVETDPSNLEALVKLSELYSKSGEADSAEEMVTRALALEPDEQHRAALEAMRDGER